MKKIFLLLFAMILSLAAMAQLNPYAYNLSSNWDATKQILTVNFKLNAHPNLDVTANGNGTGIQIFAVDRDNNNKMYYIHGIPAAEIRKKIDSNDLDYSVDIHIDGRSLESPYECLPKGKNLTFAVRVQGVNSKNKTEPGNVVYTGNRPYSPHGVAVNNCQDSQDFGAVYVTECTNGVSGNTWGWLSNKGRSLLEYNPRLEYADFHRKKNADGSDQFFSERNVVWNANGTRKDGGNLLEPHRVVISDDGRIFVSSYNQNNSNDKVAVWEYDRQTRKFTPIVYHNTSYGNRVVAIDIKGTTGNNLKMLVCYLKIATNNNGYHVYEYNIGNPGTTATVVGEKCRYEPSNGDGTQYQRIQALLAECIGNYYFHYTDGLVDVAYGAEDPTTVFIGIDYFVNTNYRTTLAYHKVVDSRSVWNYHNTTDAGQRYGGGGLVTYLDHNGNELIAMGRCQSGNNNEDDGRIQVYKRNEYDVPSEIEHTIQTNTKNIVNDIAIDCANNIYAVSFTDNTSKWPSGTGTLLAVPMPYSGTVTTYCPTSNTDDKEYFQLPAVVELDQDLSTADLQQLNKNHPHDCGCDIDVNLVRPLRGGMYNTICLPFDLNVNNLATNHPYYNATVLAFVGATISTINDESVLELNFVSTDGVIKHSTPYLIRPQSDISSGVRFDNIILQPVYEFPAKEYLVNEDDINYLGVMGKGGFSFDPNEEIVLILVSDNRLAQLSSGGTIDGFRGLFYFQKSLISEGTVVRLAERKDTPTSLIDAQGEVIDVEKFLREGRVYIRMGETLYTITGEIVE